MRCVLICALAVLALPAHAYNLLGPRWKTSRVTMHLQLGSAGGTLIDGNTSWDDVAEGALATWNTVLTNVQFSVVRDSTAERRRGNGLNNVFFATTVYGDAFGARTLGVTASNSSGTDSNSYTEADVIFNSNTGFNSYRGVLRRGSDGFALGEFRRVAIHEFGHVLGLDHPDDIGQSVAAVMNANMSDVDTIATDDINGARALYGSGVTSTAPAISTQPASQSVAVGQSANFSVSASGTAPLTYQWRRNGTAISGAVGSTYSIVSVTAADAAGYSATVSNSAGSVTSNTATLTVTAAPVTPPAGTTGTTGATGTRATAASVGLNTTASGRIATGGEVNYFRLAVTAAGTLTVATTGSMDTIGELQDANGTVLASDDDSGAASNFSITRVVGIGTYFVAVRTFLSTATGSYGLGVAFTATPGTVVTGTTGASGTRATAASVALNTTASGRIATGGEVNYFRLAVTAAGTLTVTTTGSTDTIGELQDANGTVLASDDDSGAASNFSITRVVGIGTYFVAVRTFLSTATGSYGLGVAFTATPGTVVPPVGPSAPASRLANLSVRTTLARAQTLIVGFTVSGGSKPVLVRAAGPALGALGLTGFLPDPVLELYKDSVLLESNDDWPSSLAANFAGVGAFAFSAGSFDAAFLENLSGGYSAWARSVTSKGSGTVLVEAYDAGSGSAVRLSNLSARNRVGTGNDILIAGFFIAGTGTQRVLIRAVGPSLAAFGLTGLLADPKLEIYNSAGAKITENDNWDATLSSTFSSAGAFALTPGGKDAALIVILPAGATYTVQVKGADGGTGEGLIEVYELP